MLFQFLFALYRIKLHIKMSFYSACFRNRDKTITFCSIIRVITNRIGLELGLLTLFMAEMTFYIFYAKTMLVRRLS